jgi:excisionase family DNA binding protein
MTAKKEETDTLLVSEVQRRLRISRNSVYEAIARREIPSLRFGRRIVVPRAAFEQMLNGAAGNEGTSK